jgi:dTDP-4-amino-4,6-dideoxygalactose transaminase
LESVGLDGVRAILVPHYFGLPQPLGLVRAFCDAHGIALIEDCAHMFFGFVEGSPVGTWGDLAIASLTKFYPVAEGGCLISNSRDLAEIKLVPRSLTDELKAALDVIEIGARHGRFPGLNALLRGVFRLKDSVRGRRRGARLTPLEHSTVAPSVDEYSDALLWSRLTWTSRRIVESARHSRIIELRRRNFELVAGLLADLPGAAPFATVLPAGTAPYVFPLRVTNAEARYAGLRRAGVPVFRWDRIWPGTPRIPGDHGLAWATEMFQLGCHQDLTAEDVRGIASTARKVFERFA